jgi:integrase
VLSPEELQRMFTVAANLKERAILMTLYGAGLRASELCSLRVADVDSSRMLLQVRQGKGRKDRVVKLAGHLLGVLRAYWKAYRPTEWLFPRPTLPDEPLNRTDAFRIVARTARRAGASQLRDAPARRRR